MPALALLVIAAIVGLLWLTPTDSARAQTAQTVPSDWVLTPDGIQPGDSFRLLFVTSTTRDASPPTSPTTMTTPKRWLAATPIWRISTASSVL